MGKQDSGAEFALSDEDLAARPSIFSADLMKGKRVVVSGGGSGIGRAAAMLYARLGADVAICGRTAEKLVATHDLIEQATGKSIVYRECSIRDPEAVEGFIAAVHQELGGIDILINNAGGQFPQDAIDFSRKGWLAVIDTNLNGTWWMMQEAAKAWKAAGAPGQIVNIVCTVERGCPQVAHTCAARAGVIYLSKTLATEWAPLDIKVNCLAVGATRTEGFRMYPPEFIRNFQASNPMNSLSDAFEMAEALVYMTSPAAAFMNGSIVAIDGGQAQWGVTWMNGEPEYYANLRSA